MISSRRFASLRQLCLLAALLGGALQVVAQSTVYWDTNGNSSGAGLFNSGTWSQSTGANWTTNSSGTSNTTTWSAVATGAKIADFSAGSDALTTSVTVNGTINDLAGLSFNNGLVWLSGSALSFSGASATIAANTLQASIANALSGSTAIEKTGAGILALSGNNTVSGGITLSAGTLVLGNDSALGTGTFTINAGTVQSNAARTIANNVAIGGNFTIGGSNDLTFNGTVNLGGGTRTITVDNSGVTTFAGSIIEPWYSGITKAGTGELVLAGSNSFAAPVAVNAGTLTVANNNALGTAGTSNNVVAANATLKLQNNVTITENFNVVGQGANSAGAIRNASGTNTLNGTVTLNGNTTIALDAGTLAVTGQVQTDTNTLTTTGAGNLTLSDSLYGSTFTHAGTGTVTFSGSNGNSFSTLNLNSGTLVLAKSAGTHSLTGSTLNVGDGTGSAGSAVLRLGASNQIADYAGTLNIRSDGRFELNNFAESVNTIGGTGVIDLGTSGQLTVGVNSGSSTFGGTFSGSGSVTKTGSGVLEITSDLSLAGTFVLNSGTLRLGTNTINLSALSVTGSSSIDFAGSGGTLNIGALSLAANVVLTILNWTEADRLRVDSWLGAAYNTTGAAPMNQVVFSGYSGGTTRWNSFDNSVTPYPVPEPATTGALVVAGAAGLLAWRRRRVS
jgi:autotransporter-associated beta strand protein